MSRSHDIPAQLPEVSPQAAAVLATAPPAAIPFPLNRWTGSIVRRLGDAATRDARRATLAAFDGTVQRINIAGVSVTHLKPTPAASPATDYLVYIHGGAFLLGKPVDALLPAVAARTRLDTYSIDYDLAPKARYPRALTQVLDVWRTLTSDRSGRPVLVGTSAGGNLALAALQHLLHDRNGDDNNATLPAAVVLLSPWSDLAPGTGERRTNEGTDPLIRWDGQLAKAAAAYAGARAFTDPLISPINGDYRGLTAPTLITTGTADLFHADCTRLHRVLTGQGVPAEINAAPGMWHVYQGYPDVPEAVASHEDIANFIIRALAPNERMT